jgi:hypothetical protein
MAIRARIPRSDDVREIEGWRRSLTQDLNDAQLRAMARSTVTGNTTLTLAHQMVWVDASGGAVTITMPAAADHAGVEWIIEKIDSTTNLVTIAAADTINGDASFDLLAQYESIRPQSNGSVYYT